MCCIEVLTRPCDSELLRRFHWQLRKNKVMGQCPFYGPAASDRPWSMVRSRPNVVELDCYKVRRELSDYVDGDLTPELRMRIENHLQNCSHCTAVYDGLRNVVRLLSDERAI